MSGLVFTLLCHGQSALGLPPVPIPADNPQTPAKIELGRALFSDKRFSSDGATSCSSCHDPRQAFTDAHPIALGANGQRGVRNTPSLLNSAYMTKQFWDGRRVSLESQAIDPFLNKVEHGVANHDLLLKVILSDVSYTEAFEKAFGVATTAIATDHVAKALASYERTLISANTPFDRYLFGGEMNALSEAAVRGLALFRGRAQCESCHRIGNDHALFTDNGFHRLGVGRQRVESKLSALITDVMQRPEMDVGEAIQAHPELAELGRFMVTRKPTDIGRFKTPSLRNVAVTAPYMHDGSVASLEEAVETEVYYRSIESGRPLILTPQEKSDLVDFLKALTSPDCEEDEKTSSEDTRPYPGGPFGCIRHIEQQKIGQIEP